MKPVILTFLIFMVIFQCGCSQENNSNNLPDEIKIGLLPDQGKAALDKRYKPLLTYLSKKLGVPYRIIISDTYEDLLQSFNSGEIDLAYFGGFSFIQAMEKSGAIPLVMRDIDINFTSYFIVKPDSNNTNNKIENFKNRRLVFGSKLSTSGHLMPRFFLQQNNINVENFFSDVLYSGSHDKTAYWVRDGKADIGAANSIIIDQMLKDGRLNTNDIQILWQTPPYPDYVWAVQPKYNETSRNIIRDAFLSISPANKNHSDILSSLDAQGFLPASISDFTQLNEIAHQIGLLGKR